MTGKIPPKAAAEPGGSLITSAKLQQLYVAMLHCRMLTQPPRQQRRRFHNLIGQEALITGWMIDLLPQDTLAAAAIDDIASLIKGVPLPVIAARLFARRRLALPELSDQLSAATADAAAHKRKKNGNVVVVFASAAASELASWSGALKQAARRRLPMVFVVENNPWMTAPRSTTMPQEDTITHRARRYGLPAITVDGNDVVAVYRVACESLERVRQGDGPVLVEGKTYHAAGRRTSRADRDPLIHMERYLAAKKLFTPKWKTQLRKTFSEELAAAIKAIPARAKSKA